MQQLDRRSLYGELKLCGTPSAPQLQFPGTSGDVFAFSSILVASGRHSKHQAVDLIRWPFCLCVRVCQGLCWQPHMFVRVAVCFLRVHAGVCAQEHGAGGDAGEGRLPECPAEQPQHRQRARPTLS